MIDDGDERTVISILSLGIFLVKSNGQKKKNGGCPCWSR
jgi:hypothetical protein